MNSCFLIDIIDSLAHKFFELTTKDGLEITIRKSLKLENSKNQSIDEQLRDNIKKTMASLKLLQKIPNRYNASFVFLPLFNEKLSPSVIQALILELKPLIEHLEYVYLGEGDTLPIIIEKNLTTLQKQKPICVLKENKTVII